MESLAEDKEVWWTSKGSDIQIGDLVVISKYISSEQNRGIVGYGEVAKGLEDQGPEDLIFVADQETTQFSKVK